MLDYRTNYEKFIDEHKSQINEIKEDLKHISVNRIHDQEFDLDELVETTKMKIISLFNLALKENVKSNLQDFDNKRRELFKKPGYKNIINLYTKTYNQLIEDTYGKISKEIEVEPTKLKKFIENPVKNCEKFSLKFLPPKFPDTEPTKKETEEAMADYAYYSMAIPKENNLESNDIYDLENTFFVKFSIEDSIFNKYKLDERQLFYYADKYGIMNMEDKQ